ncbi:MAG: response regulator transcription factor [Oligoflexia bacterium]|nr:response regulator transcription factor [Oligoflexia bacterium]
MTEILLVEDDPVLGRGLCLNLEHEGYKVHWANSLHAAMIANKRKNLELIVLDVGLPDGSGFDFLKEIRKAGSRIPVLVLTAKTDVDSVVEGLQFGANDYIRKPFDDRELLARIKTALNEPQIRSHQVRYGGLLVLIDQRKVLHDGKEIELSPREFDILAFFVQNAEAVLTRDRLLEAIDKNGDLFDRTIDSNVSHLRSRLKAAGVHSVQIGSVYGVGYRLEKK